MARVRELHRLLSQAAEQAARGLAIDSPLTQESVDGGARVHALDCL
jgi:hypothetical protein